MNVEQLISKSDNNGKFFEPSILNYGLLEILPSPTFLKISLNAHYQDDKKLDEKVLMVQIRALLCRIPDQHTGFVLVKTFIEETQKNVLYGFCMSQLYLYVCSEANCLVTQDSFLPVYLNYINFYAEQQKARLQFELKRNLIKI